MKKIFGYLAFVAILFSMVACGGSGNSVSGGPVEWDTSNNKKKGETVKETTLTVTLKDAYFKDASSVDVVAWFTQGSGNDKTTLSSVSAALTRDDKDFHKATIKVSAAIAPTKPITGKWTLTIPKDNLAKDDKAEDAWEGDAIEITDAVEFKLDLTAVTFSATKDSTNTVEFTKTSGTWSVDTTNNKLTLTGLSATGIKADSLNTMDVTPTFYNKTTELKSSELTAKVAVDKTTLAQLKLVLTFSDVSGSQSTAISSDGKIKLTVTGLQAETGYYIPDEVSIADAGAFTVTITQ